MIFSLFAKLIYISCKLLSQKLPKPIFWEKRRKQISKCRQLNVSSACRALTKKSFVRYSTKIVFWSHNLDVQLNLQLRLFYTFTALWVNLADDKLMISFLIFQENRTWYFHTNYEDYLHEMSNPVLWGK